MFTHNKGGKLSENMTARQEILFLERHYATNIVTHTGTLSVV